MKRLILVAALGLCAAPAMAQSDTGTFEYTVQGTNFDGSPYGGDATITIVSETTCEIVWTTGQTASKGICMRNGDSFAAGYVMGEAVGLVIYKVMPDGSLNGLWTIAGKNGMGTEVLAPKK